MEEETEKKYVVYWSVVGGGSGQLPGEYTDKELAIEFAKALSTDGKFDCSSNVDIRYFVGEKK